MSFIEPNTKIVTQGFRETDFMYLIQQGSCLVSVYDQNINTQHMQDIAIRTL